MSGKVIQLNTTKQLAKADPKVLERRVKAGAHAALSPTASGISAEDLLGFLRSGLDLYMHHAHFGSLHPEQAREKVAGVARAGARKALQNDASKETELFKLFLEKINSLTAEIAQSPVTPNLQKQIFKLLDLLLEAVFEGADNGLARPFIVQEVNKFASLGYAHGHSVGEKE